MWTSQVNSTKNLVVDGAITTDTIQHQIILSYTGDYFAISAQEMATGAIVYISDGTNIIPLRELESGCLYYRWLRSRKGRKKIYTPCHTSGWP